MQELNHHKFHSHLRVSQPRFRVGPFRHHALGPIQSNPPTPRPPFMLSRGCAFSCKLRPYRSVIMTRPQCASGRGAPGRATAHEDGAQQQQRQQQQPPGSLLDSVPRSQGRAAPPQYAGHAPSSPLKRLRASVAESWRGWRWPNGGGAGQGQAGAVRRPPLPPTGDGTAVKAYRPRQRRGCGAAPPAGCTGGAGGTRRAAAR